MMPKYGCDSMMLETDNTNEMEVRILPFPYKVGLPIVFVGF